MINLTNLYKQLRKNFLPPSKNDLEWRFNNLFLHLDALLFSINQLNETQRRHVGYAARKEIGNILNFYSREPDRLEHFGFKVYSQSDEDGIIEEIFNRLEIDKGVFCEIGVENGLECNSLYLLHKNWEGAWIEGNPDQKDHIEKKFHDLLGSRLELVTSFVTRDNVNHIINNLSFADKEIDLLSIDIDGNDIYLMEAMSLTPKVICIEYNSKFPANIKKQQTYNPSHVWRGTDYFGASLSALTEVASNKGYVLVGTNITGTNAFFVRKDLALNKFVEAGNVAKLYNPPRYWLIPDHYYYIGHPADFGSYHEYT
jgi:hypothetical protein